MVSDHDTAYKQLFAHPEMVRDLLRGYLPYDLLARLDLATLERVNGSYADGEGTQRHSDMVWKVCQTQRWPNLYVLLEFQSKPDPWMALRMVVYVGLLYQHLLKRHEVAADGLLPLVLPIVLYDGIRPWIWLRSRLPGPCGLPSMGSGDQPPGGDAMLPTVEEAVEYWKYGERLREAQDLLMRALIKRFGDAGKAMSDDVSDADLAAVRRWHNRFAEQKNLLEIFAEDS